jgi:hypothetical protein
MNIGPADGAAGVPVAGRGAVHVDQLSVLDGNDIPHERPPWLGTDHNGLPPGRISCRADQVMLLMQ